MVVRGGFVLLIIEQFLDRGFLIGAPPQQKQHPSQRLSIGYWSLIKLRPRQWVHVSVQHDKIFLVDNLSDADPDTRCLRLRSSLQSGEWGLCESAFHKARRQQGERG